MLSELLTFIASIAPLQSAIMIAHDGGARVKLDIPESELSKIGKVMGLRGKVLRVSVQVVKQQRHREIEPEWGDDTEDDNTG